MSNASSMSTGSDCFGACAFNSGSARRIASRAAAVDEPGRAEEVEPPLKLSLARWDRCDGGGQAYVIHSPPSSPSSSLSAADVAVSPTAFGDDTPAPDEEPLGMVR